MCGRIARIADRNINLNILEKAQSGPNVSAKADGPGAWEQASGHLDVCLQVTAAGVWEGRGCLCLQQGKILLLNTLATFCKFLSLSEPLLTYGDFTTSLIEVWGQGNHVCEQNKAWHLTGAP